MHTPLSRWLIQLIEPEQLAAERTRSALALARCGAILYFDQPHEFVPCGAPEPNPLGDGSSDKLSQSSESGKQAKFRRAVRIAGDVNNAGAQFELQAELVHDACIAARC